MRSLEDISKTNPEKPLLLTVDGKEYYRYPIHTHLIRVGENLSELMRQYVLPYLRRGTASTSARRLSPCARRTSSPRSP